MIIVAGASAQLFPGAPFALLPGSSPWLVGVVILLSALAEMTGILGATVGRGRRYDGPMGKSDRAAVFGAVALAAGAGVSLEPALNWIWLAVSAILALPIAHRMRGV